MLYDFDFYSTVYQLNIICKVLDFEVIGIFLRVTHLTTNARIRCFNNYILALRYLNSDTFFLKNPPRIWTVNILIRIVHGEKYLSKRKIFRENETLDVLEFEHLMFKALRIIRRMSIAIYSGAQMKCHVYHKLEPK